MRNRDNPHPDRTGRTGMERNSRYARYWPLPGVARVIPTGGEPGSFWEDRGDRVMPALTCMPLQGHRLSPSRMAGSYQRGYSPRPPSSPTGIPRTRRPSPMVPAHTSGMPSSGTWPWQQGIRSGEEISSVTSARSSTKPSLAPMLPGTSGSLWSGERRACSTSRSRPRPRGPIPGTGEGTGSPGKSRRVSSILPRSSGRFPETCCGANRRSLFGTPDPGHFNDPGN